VRGKDLEDTRDLPLQYTPVENSTGGHDSQELAPGTPVGAYTITAKIASGGGGTVYRARSADGGAVAIKVILPELAASPQALGRFQREAEAVRLVNHPNIVTVVESGALPDGRPYIVMELVEGETLRDRLRRRGRLTPAEVLEILEPTCSALAAAHGAGLVHRDLKASNISVGPDELPRVKLLDFGIVKLVQPDSTQPSLTVQGSRLGTPYTMAPEQIRGEPVDARADVYALGVLIFHMLTGRYPFIAPTAQEIERLHLEIPPPRPSHTAAVPPALEAVVLRCLAKQPAARFASVGELVAAFREAVLARPQGDEEREAVGIVVEAVASGADPDELLEDTAAVMDLAEGALREAGFELPLQTGNLVLGVQLVEEEGARGARCQAAFETARRLARQIAERPEARAELAVTVAVHAGPVQVRGGEMTGGGLLRTAEWPLDAERDGVRLSAPATAGLA
jgi:serine/threonine-protein kinase